MNAAGPESGRRQWHVARSCGHVGARDDVYVPGVDGVVPVVVLVALGLLVLVVVVGVPAGGMVLGGVVVG